MYYIRIVKRNLSTEKVQVVNTKGQPSINKIDVSENYIQHKLNELNARCKLSELIVLSHNGRNIRELSSLLTNSVITRRIPVILLDPSTKTIFTFLLRTVK